MQVRMSTKKPSFTIEEREAIGARLKMLRQSQGRDGLLQTEMAERIGVTASHYTKIERGRNFVSERLLRDVARECGVSYEWLAYGDGPQAPAAGESGQGHECAESAAQHSGASPSPGKGTVLHHGDIAMVLRVSRDPEIQEAARVLARALGVGEDEALARVVSAKMERGA